MLVNDKLIAQSSLSILAHANVHDLLRLFAVVVGKNGTDRSCGTVPEANSMAFGELTAISVLEIASAGQLCGIQTWKIFPGFTTDGQQAV